MEQFSPAMVDDEVSRKTMNMAIEDMCGILSPIGFVKRTASFIDER
jgi:hypothetical protein